MSIEAMKQALQALKFFCEYGVIDRPFERIAELKQAIAEAEKQPVHASDISQERVDETAKREHEFKEMVKKGTKAWAGTPDNWVDELRGGEEPVAWMCEANVFGSGGWKRSLCFVRNDNECFRNWKPLYARPEPCTEVGTNSGVLHKEWVGLTDEEVADYWVAAFNENGLYVQTFASLIEAKLKERNT